MAVFGYFSNHQISKIVNKVSIQPFKIAAALKKRMDMQLINGQRTTPYNLYLQWSGKRRVDFLWLNTHGSSDNFSVRGLGKPEDLPFGQSCTVYMIHSFSALAPWSSTVSWSSGRWRLSC